MSQKARVPSIERLWYNKVVTEVTSRKGLNFKLDVGLYRLDQQVACQRIGKPLQMQILKIV